MSYSNLPERNGKPNAIERRLRVLSERFGESHLILAAHAAFPMAIATDLLYCIWAKFQFDIHGNALNIPWFAVSDLLLFGLFEEVGYELYELDKSLRDALLNYLKNHPHFGQKRLQELASFLLAYVHHQPKTLDLDEQDLAQAQNWTALVYIQPNKVANELASTLSRVYQQDELELIRITHLIETLAEPLKDAGFEALLVYAWGMKELLNKGLSRNFNGLIKLDTNPQEIHEQFIKLLNGEESTSIFVPTEENSLRNYRRSALQVISIARKEAEKLRHNFICPEHILLGLIQQEKSIAVEILRSSGVTRQTLIYELTKVLQPTPGFWKNLRNVMLPTIAFNIRGKRVLAFSEREAHQLTHDFIDAEHLFLGLIQEGDNLACIILENLDIDLLEIRAQIIQRLSRNIYALNATPTEVISYENYDESTLLALKSAKQESIALGQNFVSTEQILVGILKQTGIDRVVLGLLDITLEDIQNVVETIGGWRIADVKGKMHYTPRAKRVLMFSQAEARRLGHDSIHVSHLLLGLIQEVDNTACTILANLNVNISKIRTRAESRANAVFETSPLARDTSDQYGFFGRFTEKAIKAILFAQEENRRLRHNYVGTEQILLGLIKQETGIAAKVLKSTGINLKKARIEVQKIIGVGFSFVGEEVPFTIGAKRLLELAVEISQHLNYLDTEHLLLAIIESSESLAYTVLEKLGVDPLAIRSQVLQMRDEVEIPQLSETETQDTFTEFRGLNLEGCTESLNRAIVFAQKEAHRLKHNFLGTETVLLGLIQENTSVVSKVLASQGVTFQNAQIEIEAIIGYGSSPPEVELTLTPKAIQTFESASNLVYQLGLEYMDTEHLLLAIIQQHEGIAFTVLENLGVDISAVCSQLLPTEISLETDNITEISDVHPSAATIPFENFTQKAIIAIQLALEEARLLNKNFIAGEQIFLGLIAEGTDVAAKVLQAEGVNLKNARLEVEKAGFNVGKITGQEVKVLEQGFLLTQSARRVFKLAIEEAHKLGHDYIGTGHLLLGAIREENSIIIKILINLNIDYLKIRQQVRQIIDK